MGSGINEEKQNESMDFQDQISTPQFLEKAMRTWI